jgi:hypothetical protein
MMWTHTKYTNNVVSADMVVTSTTECIVLKLYQCLVDYISVLVLGSVR